MDFYQIEAIVQKQRLNLEPNLKEGKKVVCGNQEMLIHVNTAGQYCHFQ